MGKGMDGELGAERIRAAAKGDRDAAEAVIRALLPRVRNLVRYLLRGDRDVDDITQTALLVVLKGLPTFRGDAPFERWADRLVARETFRHLKRRRMIDAQEVESEIELTGSDGRDRDLLERRAVAVALDELPEAQRVVVALHHVAGFTVPELAELLEIPRETVRSRLRLGMVRLRERFAKEEAS
ncbi:MAG: sigma-70 family RNA polymerase sigma factor [Myxococcota bacterium]